jgi:hypothetical protein
MILGGLIRIDLLEVVPHAQTPSDPHIRITAFTNLIRHLTSTPKAETILHEQPSSFHDRKSQIEIVTNRAMGPVMKVALETDVRSTGNSQRNTLEIVVAGQGFVAVGGNFERARVRVWTPEGRGVGVRRPIVREIEGGDSLMVVRKPKWTRLVSSWRKNWRGVVPERDLGDDVVPLGFEGVDGQSKRGRKMEGWRAKAEEAKVKEDEREKVEAMIAL